MAGCVKRRAFKKRCSVGKSDKDCLRYPGRILQRAGSRPGVLKWGKSALRYREFADMLLSPRGLGRLPGFRGYDGNE